MQLHSHQFVVQFNNVPQGLRTRNRVREETDTDPGHLRHPNILQQLVTTGTESVHTQSCVAKYHLLTYTSGDNYGERCTKCRKEQLR